uniref:hypothetical protein n=1 Tax=Agathobacter sp. TaxID=2021311 RepID=UPI0040575E26
MVCDENGKDWKKSKLKKQKTSFKTETIGKWSVPLNIGFLPDIGGVFQNRWFFGRRSFWRIVFAANKKEKGV